jgi:CBS domain-containing protein
MRRDVATCRPDEPSRPDERVWDKCVVTTESGVVLGVAPAAAKAAAAMVVGPATVRADQPVTKLVERMDHRSVSSFLVTDPDGRLLGVLLRDDAVSALGKVASTSASSPPASGP